MPAKFLHRRSFDLAAIAVAFGVGACGSNAPLPVVPASAPVVIRPGAQLDQFSTAVGELGRNVELARTIPTARYADLSIAIRSLADAVQLLPRGADAIATIDAASAIRADVGHVGSPVIDDPQSTVAAERALQTAARAFDDVIWVAYSDTPELGPMVGDLDGAVRSIDTSRLLADERQDVLRALDQSVLILQTIERAAGGEPQVSEICNRTGPRLARCK